MVTPGICLPVGDDIKTKLSLRTLHTPIGFTRRNAHLVLGLACLNWTFRNLLDDLLQNANALADFIHTDKITVVHIPVVTHSYIELEPVVNRIRICTA